MKYLYKYLIRPVLYFGLVFPAYYLTAACIHIVYFLWNFKVMPAGTVDWSVSEEAVSNEWAIAEICGDTYFWYSRYKNPWHAFIKRKTYRRYRVKKGIPEDMEYVLRP